MGASGKAVDILVGRTTRPSLRKCRSTKVDTARGPKDRRVRLSPETAIQFYDVQDRLGYERASEAIDWLMEKSKDSIDKLFDIPSQHYDHFVRPGDSNDLKMSNEGDFEEAVVYVQNIPSGSLSDYVNNLSGNSCMENSVLFPHLHMIENSCFPSSLCEPSVRIPFSNEVSKSYNSTQRHQYQEEFEGLNQGIFPIHASNNHVESMADI